MEFLDHVVILCLIFLRNRHTYFHSGRPILRSYQRCLRTQFLREYFLDEKETFEQGAEECEGGSNGKI